MGHCDFFSKQDAEPSTSFPNVLKCAGPDYRLIAHNVFVQDFKKIFNFIIVSAAELYTY